MSDMEKFRALGISEPILAALEKKGFEEPSPIQAATIPLLLGGEKDVIGQAQTGTGKTAAFGIPILERIGTHSRHHIKALILAPTRELAIQIAEEIASLRAADNPLEILPIYGGQSIDIQLRRLRYGVDIVVGTPGRVIDLIDRQALDLSKLSFAVLDEADEMLNMGFVEDIETILGHTNADKRMLMFSATMPPPIMGIAEKFMKEYEIVRIKQPQMTALLTDQIYFEVRRENKFEALTRIIDMEPELYALVFCRTKNDVDEVAEKLLNRGYTAEALHGDLSQAQRTKVIERFKRHNFNILIATDVAARGIDINNLTHVINYSIPQDPESYVHRVGRTGRAGKEGTAITFVTPAESRTLMMIQRAASTDIRKESLPRGDEIIRHKREQIKERLAALIADDSHADYLEMAKELADGQEPLNMLAALLKFTFKDEFKAENYHDLSPASHRVDNEGRTRLFVALGRDDGYGARQILDLLWEKAHVKGYRVGKINCFDKFSFVTVSFSDAKIILDVFRESGRNGAPLITVAKDKDAPDAEHDSGHADEPRRPDRFESSERPERPPRQDYSDRRDRPPRQDHSDRQDRPRRTPRPDYSDRQDRRPDRPRRNSAPESANAPDKKRSSRFRNVPDFGDNAIVQRAMKKMRKNHGRQG